jgi:hypothetical protein
MKLFGKTTMQKLETALAALRKRATLLSDKRVSAQAALDTAVSARQAMLLDGDLEDHKLAAKLQSAVDTGQSALVGLDGAISALQVQIDNAQQELTAERQRVDRQAASEALAASISSIKAKLEPWLTATRAFAKSLESVAHVRFEPGQIAAYVGRCAGEVEIAVAVMLEDLHRLESAIAGGQEPIPRDPEVGAPAPAAPKPVTVRLFAMRAVKWTDAAGMQRFIGKYNDVDLPERAAAFALKNNICVELTDPRRKQLHGLSPGHPEPHWCVDLDDETETALAEEKSRPDEQRVVHSAFQQQLPSGFEPLDRGRGFVIKVPAGNPTPAGEGEAA